MHAEAVAGIVDRIVARYHRDPTCMVQILRDKGMTVSPANRQLFLERVVKRSTPEQLGARPGDYARLQALTN